MKLEDIEALRFMDHGELLERAAALGVEPPGPDDVFTTADALRLRIIDATVDRELNEEREPESVQRLREEGR